MRTFFAIAFMMNISIANSQEIYLLAGTYTSGKSEGIYVCRFNTETGQITNVGAAKSSNPSYLAVSGSNVYAVNENGGDHGGGISAFKFDKTSGHLTLLNAGHTGGDHPCYIAVDDKKKFAIAGNYSGGNFSVFPLAADGSLQPAQQIVQHQGKGKDPERQEKPHVHATVFGPGGHTVWVSDLGTDEVRIYSYQPERPEPLRHQSTIKITAGGGPRHLVFHPDGRFVYIMEELSGMVSVYDVRSFKLVDRCDSHPPGYTGERGSADIHVSPDGKFLYASNRGQADNIAIFSINEKNGKLKSAGHQPTLGKKPRNFVISPDGKFLLVANQQSGSIIVFERDMKTGGLTQRGGAFEIPDPVCLKFPD